MVKRISIFGDSITWGKADTEHGGWVGRLRKHLEESSDYTIEVYNLGVSGDTTNDLAKRFNSEAEARDRKSQIIVFAIGINDSYYIEHEDIPHVSIKQFESNLQLLTKNAKKMSEAVIFIGPTEVDENQMPRKETNYYKNDRIKKYSTIIQKVCESEDIPFLDMLKVVDVDDLYDGLHPNSRGHEKMFQIIRKFLNELGIF